MDTTLAFTISNDATEDIILLLIPFLFLIRPRSRSELLGYFVTARIVQILPSHVHNSLLQLYLLLWR
jgi:hypothetical protein